MSRGRNDTFTMLGSGLGGHVARRGWADRWRRVPEGLEGAAPPAQHRLEDLTRSGLARRGADFYDRVAMEHDPICARAEAALSEAQRHLVQLQDKEAEAVAAAADAPTGAADDPSRQAHRRARLAREARQAGEAEVAVVQGDLADANARRAAAVAAAREKGWEHLTLGRAAIHGYWEWLLRSKKRRAPSVIEVPADLDPAPWMTANTGDIRHEEGG